MFSVITTTMRKMTLLTNFAICQAILLAKFNPRKILYLQSFVPIKYSVNYSVNRVALHLSGYQAASCHNGRKSFCELSPSIFDSL